MGKTFKQNDRHSHKGGKDFSKIKKPNKHQFPKKWKTSTVDDPEREAALEDIRL